MAAMGAELFMPPIRLVEHLSRYMGHLPRRCTQPSSL